MRVLVTGGTRGIGRAIVEAIVARGKDHVVYLGCRDIRAGTALAAALGGTIVPLELDVTDRASITAAAATVAASGQLLDAVVCNAGVMLERDGGDLAATVEPTFRVNVDGVMAVTEALLSQIADGGQLVTVSSGAGTRATGELDERARAELAAADAPALRAAAYRLATEVAGRPCAVGATPVYGLSKAAVNYYTRLIARENPRLRANACSPGFCRTEIAGPGVAYTREPKDAALGADVATKLLFGDLGSETGLFYKECSKPGASLAEARSAVEPWH